MESDFGKLDKRPKKRPKKGSIEAAFNFNTSLKNVVYLEPKSTFQLPDLPPGKKYVVDLFAGIGGFSCGAAQAGHIPVLAIDSNAELLQCHAANHTNCRHIAMELGPETEDFLIQTIQEMIPDPSKLHLHGSPPCTMLSKMQGPRRSMHNGELEKDHDVGMSTVTWFLRLVIRMRPASWTFEQISTHDVFGALALMQECFPTLVDVYKRLRMNDFGVPQERTRCIAGSPHLIQRLKTDATLLEPAPSIEETLAPPAGAAYVKSSWGRFPDPAHTVDNGDGTFTNNKIFSGCYRPLDRIAPTCLAGNPMTWTKSDYTGIRRFSVREHATLQTFPESFTFMKLSVPSILGIGNAFPPKMVKKIMASL